MLYIPNWKDLKSGVFKTKNVYVRVLAQIIITLVVVRDLLKSIRFVKKNLSVNSWQLYCIAFAD